MKDQPKKTYLTIQKTVKLLKPEHIEFFKQHLQANKATLPFKLVSSIEPGFDDSTDIEELCRRVYGKYDLQTRRNFNQLASYTFQLTAILSKNFPNYLSHNLGQLDILLVNGLYEEANLLCECILDIAERIGDSTTKITCLKFLAQQALLQDSQAEALRIHETIKETIEEEQVINDLYIYLRSNFDIGRKDDSPLKQLDKHLAFFKEFHTHKAIKVRLLSKYGSNFIQYYFGADSDDLLVQLDKFFDELHKNGIIVFPLLEDLLSKTGFLTLNNSTVNIQRGKGRDQYNQFIKHIDQVSFWKNYNHLPDLFLITIKSTHYASRHHPQIHKKEYLDTLPENTKNDIQQLLIRCESILQSNTLQTRFINDYIKLRVAYGALLMVGGNDKIQKAISDLEELMITFQQSSFSASIDSIFACLMIGYFALGNYKYCAETFNRYIKLSKGRSIISENDIEIHTYYYISQWLYTGRYQYLRKLEDNYLIAEAHVNKESLTKSLELLANDFSLDVKFVKA